MVFSVTFAASRLRTGASAPVVVLTSCAWSVVLPPVSSETSRAHSLTWQDGLISPVQQVCALSWCDVRHLGSCVPWQYARCGASFRPAKPSFVCDTTTTAFGWNHGNEQRTQIPDERMDPFIAVRCSWREKSLFVRLVLACLATCKQCHRSACNCILMHFLVCLFVCWRSQQSDED